MTSSDDTLLVFPCDFPIKIMGIGDGGLREAIESVVETQQVETVAITERPSSGGNYLAVTLTIRATSQQQLDDLYRRIGALEAVRVVL